MILRERRDCARDGSSSGAISWIDRELAGCEFADVRLGRRFHNLLEQIGGAVGESIPLACQDWTNTKAAYRCGFRCNWSSDSGGKWSAIPVGSGPGFRWEVVQFLEVYRNGGPLAGMVDHITVTVDQITGIGQV